MVIKIYNLNLNSNKTIVNISDIHYSTDYKFNLDKLYNKILNINPDYICITGDIIDSIKYYDHTIINFLKKLTKINKVLVSLGNHDIYEKELTDYKFIDKIKKIHNLYVLDNSSYKDANITFYGYTMLKDSYKLKDQFYDFKNRFNFNNEINILLMHSPEYITKYKEYFNNVDLILCGHTHNGMLPNIIKGNTGLISSNKKLFPKYARNSYKFNDTTVIICGGIVKLSKKTNLHNLNFIYQANIDIIKLGNS